jgi:hypothetical protein
MYLLVAHPARYDGWSGCFVGRPDMNRRAWEFIGTLSATATSSVGEAVFVTRPPIQVLDWLVRGDASGVELTTLRVYAPRILTPEEITEHRDSKP